MKFKTCKKYGEYIYEDSLGNKVKFRTPEELICFIESKEKVRLSKDEKEEIYYL